MSAYREDLAHIHDVGFGDFARQAAPALLDILSEGKITSGLVVDLGCGSGLWALALHRAGYDVLGVDISPAMINIARKRVPGGDFRTGSFFGIEMPPCAAVTSLGECFNYMFDSEVGRHELTRLFSRVYEAISPNGLFIFDLLEPRCLSGARTRQSQAEGDGWTVLVHAEEDQKRRILTRRITSFRKDGELYRRQEETHHLRLYPRSQIASDLRRVGFRVRVVRGYGSVRFRPAHVGFLARKP